MKEKTYLKMTKKQPFRRIKLFKQKYLTKPRIYSFLAKIKLVKEVTKYDVEPIYNNSIINKVRILSEKITTDRGVFSLSYYTRGENHIAKQWYETKFTKKPKILYVVYDTVCTYLTVEVHADCERFEVRIDPFNHSTVRRQYPHYVVRTPLFVGKSVFDDDIGTIEFRTIKADFLNTRFANTYTIKVDSNIINDDIVSKCLQESIIQLKNYIEGHAEEINERLTGVKADGEFVTEDGQRLLPNNLCPRCGRPLFKSSIEGYTAQCIRCDEDFYGCEIKKVDPVFYNEVYEHCKEEFYYHLIAK